MPNRFHSLIRFYLPDLIYGANDGIVTTLVVMAGATGADLSATVILILALANLIADGFSMGASNILSKRSVLKAPMRPGLSQATRHGLATFIGFVVAGLLPLVTYFLPGFEESRFAAACGAAMAALFLIGAARAFFTRDHWLAAGLEMLALGACASGVAYGIGFLARLWISGVEMSQ